jgi:hypothetical protein
MSKLTWKLTFKKGNATLLDRISIKRDARQINVIFYSDQTTLKIGSTHPIWTSLSVNSRAFMVPFLTLETVDDRLVQIG